MATYKEIQNYVKENYSYCVKTCWIGHMKELCGLTVRMAGNRYLPDSRTNPCPANKQNAIRDAF